MTGIRGSGASRTGLARCGYTRLGWAPYSPAYRAAIKAVAEIIAGHWSERAPAHCGIARCGLSRLGHRGSTQVWAGQIPQVCTADVTVALTERPGGPADPRQEYADAYDNPAYTLHIIGEDLPRLDEVAHMIREGADRTAHISTEYGTVNTLQVGPPSRTLRTSRPRYDIQMAVNAEFIREDTQEA